MSIKINGTDVVDNNRKGIFQSTNVGTFANPARPGSAATGDLIWSTTDNQLQVWNGSAWVAAVGAGQAITASGGNDIVTTNGYKLHIFTSPGTFTLSNTAAVEYLVVAGGGGGGAVLTGPASGGAGGGGAGGLITGSGTWSPGSYTVTIGGGGGSASNGSNSSVSGPSASVTASGGGAGGSAGNNGSPGGSGGGGGGGIQFPSTPYPAQPNTNYSGGSGAPGQGFPGGGGNRSYQGAGGGAGDKGGSTAFVDPTGSRPAYFGYLSPLDGGYRGGPGLQLNWGIPGSYGDSLTNRSGFAWFSGGGGSSGAYSPGGGIGGGGPRPSAGPTTGATNTGGGGGGSSSPGSGGSGIVIIKYATIQ